MTMLAVIALLGAVSVASAQSTQAFSRSAVLGTTRLRIETSVTPLAVSNDGVQRFRLRGTMTITVAGGATYSVNPWRSIAFGADANGIADGFSAIDITDARLAYLAGEP